GRDRGGGAGGPGNPRDRGPADRQPAHRRGGDMTIGLYRELAPISDGAWRRIEQESRDVLRLHLAARRLVDFGGAPGWLPPAVALGRVEPLAGFARSGASFRRRVVRPLIELRVAFELDRQELERIDRGAASVDLDPLRDAARLFAAAEDSALFD